MVTQRLACVAITLLLLGAGGLAGCARRDSTVAVGPPSAAPGGTGAAPSTTAATDPAAKTAPLVVQGQAVAVSRVPKPGSVPYQDCLTFIKYKVLSVESGSYSKPEILAVHWGMKGNKLMPAAGIKVGDRHRLELEPFDSHPELERVMQANDTDEYALTPYWAR